MLADIWPSPADVQAAIDGAVTRELFSKSYEDVYAGPAAWQAIAPSWR